MASTGSITSRRTFLIGGACMAAAASLPGAVTAAMAKKAKRSATGAEQRRTSHDNDCD